MINLPMLKKDDLEVLKGKKVILCGVRALCFQTSHVLKTLNIQVIGYHMLTQEPNGVKVFLNKFRGRNYLTYAKIEKIVRNDNNVIIQCVDLAPEDVDVISDYFKDLNVKISPFNAGEFLSSFGKEFLEYETKHLFRFCCHLRLEQCASYFRKLIRKKKIKRLCEKNQLTDSILICMPPKTADYTLEYTFKHANNNVPFLNLWHEPRKIDKKVFLNRKETIKIIMGVREPIAQNLSDFYQKITHSSFALRWMEQESETIPFSEYRILLKKHIDFFESFGGDVEQLWNKEIEAMSWCLEKQKYLTGMHPYYGYIQSFITLFQNHVVDILSQPFDQEKGYAIVKEGNIEVFVYQLEKLNSLVPELSAWVGVPFDKLERGNAAEDKWVADSYKQAQKEIGISQEYFDKCFDEPYVKHCYSTADIEKFKARWRPHIRS